MTKLNEFCNVYYDCRSRQIALLIYMYFTGKSNSEAFLIFRFVFIMGTAMALSFQSQIRRNVPRWKMFSKIVKRSLTLFLLGLLINSFGVRNGTATALLISNGSEYVFFTCSLIQSIKMLELSSLCAAAVQRKCPLRS